MVAKNELRIRNWINPIDTDVALEVCGLPDSTTIVCKHYPTKKWFSPNEIKGVPLTADILLACGFEEKEKNFFIYGDYTMLQDMGGWHFDYLDADSRGQRSIAYPEYLHQLQNLYFALTVKELEININQLINPK